MKKQSVDDLHRTLLNVFVSAMHRVARLEADDRFPTAAFELDARLHRRKTRRIVFAREHPDGATDEHVFTLVEHGDARMLLVFGSIDVLRFAQLIVLEYFLNVDDAAESTFRIDSAARETGLGASSRSTTRTTGMLQGGPPARRIDVTTLS